MAIALEADFRSLKPSQSAERTERQQGKKPGHGEEFASSLARARDTDDAKDSPDAAAGPSAGSSGLPLLPPVTEPPITPEMEAIDAAITQPLGAEAEEAILKSEIVVDRQIVREGVDAQALSSADPETIENADAQRLHATPLSPGPLAQALEAGITVEPATSTTTQEAGKLAAKSALQASQSMEAGGAPAETTVTSTSEGIAAAMGAASVVVIAPMTSAKNGETPATQPIQTTEALADPDAFALTAFKGEQGVSPGAAAADTGIASLTDIGAKGSALDVTSPMNTTATSTQTLAAVAPAAPQTTASAPGLMASAPALAVMTASPAQIVDIVAETADDGQSDRVVVQLDPPELGRVSIDFKFDAQGLQHVTITSETPEAMRQLRQMHSELVLSLERHGIGSENLSFQHQQQGSPQSPPPNPFARAAALGDAVISGPAVLTSADQLPGARTLPGGRLDIRL